jgi:hypothetical protein
MTKLIVTHLPQKTHVMAEPGEADSDIGWRTTRSLLEERRLG